MTEPVVSKMKDFVESQITNITAEHEKMMFGWRNVDLTEENIKHLYGLFKKCSRQELRIFEERNFLGRADAAERYELITKRLTSENECSIIKENGETKKAALTKGLAKKKGNKKKEKNLIEKNTNALMNGHSTGNVSATDSNKTAKRTESRTRSPKTTAKDNEVISRELISSEASTNEAAAKDRIETPDTVDSVKEQPTRIRQTNAEEMALKKRISGRIESKPNKNLLIKTNVEYESTTTISNSKYNDDVFKTFELPKQTVFQSEINAEVAIVEEDVKTNEKTENSHSQLDKEVTCKATKTEELPKKNRNPFDNEHLFIEPLLSSTSNTKNVENMAELHSMNNYMSRESTALKSSLQKLAIDISTEEQQIRTRLEMGGPATVDDGVLEDFISRANTVLKETEAVTVRKIAEAETRQFLSSLRLPSEHALEQISNELIQDIWPKSNRWRSFARVRNYDAPPLDEIDLKEKRKREEQVERDVKAAIKSAGEPLNKKQIGQIRKAAIAYRDFDMKEQQEIDCRSNHILKLVELVSAYEASSKMDELMLMRLAIAFCTKRRDYFLKFKPPNFMQFSYMYIFLLEKINSKTASICACLNYQSTVSDDFEELEELMLNLFHEDYFLESN